VEFPDGIVHCFDGEQGKERLTKIEFPGGLVQHYEGEKDDERMTRIEFSDGTMRHYAGERGKERFTKIKYPDGRLYRSAHKRVNPEASSSELSENNYEFNEAVKAAEEAARQLLLEEEQTSKKVTKKKKKKKKSPSCHKEVLVEVEPMPPVSSGDSIDDKEVDASNCIPLEVDSKDSVDDSNCILLEVDSGDNVDDKEFDDSECVVCWSFAKTHVVVPCGHKCLCEACAAKTTQCPMCRRSAHCVIRVFE
jgi:hypothetical protein